MKLIVTGKTFPIKDELVALGGQWRPDKGGFLIDSTPMIEYYIRQIQKEKPHYNIDYYEVDEAKFREAPKDYSNLNLAKKCVKQIIEILTRQNKLLNSEKFDLLEENAEKYREEVIQKMEAIKAYILDKPIDTSLRQSEKKLADCHAMLCGSTTYSLRLTDKARINANVIEVNRPNKPSLSVDGPLDPIVEARFMKI